MPESWATRRARWRWNWIPAWRGTGARVTYIADDWREVRVALPLNRQTRNVVGTIFGGSLYAAADPVYMIMLIQLLGPGHQVWDKAASIRFLRPGRTTLFARFELPEEETTAIRRGLESSEKLDRVYQVDLVDVEGVAHASVEKTVNIRRRR